MVIFFFFQAEDGIRDADVTGVQTCALPILRVAASAKHIIQRAMAVTGLTAGDLAYEGARRVLDEHERMVLTGGDRDAFLDAISSPPTPTKKLVTALKRHRKLFG